MKKRTIRFGALAAILILTAGTLCCADVSGGKDNRKVTPVPPSEREVGIAYTSWMDNDIWGNTWGMPALGRYDSRDRRVMRKHAEWLTDAGVDFIWLDWSNNVTYDPDEFWVGGKQDLIEDATAILFDEYYKLGKVGMKHPKISIFIGVTGAPEAADDGRLQKKADQVYDMYANNPKYKDMMQLYLGKPLLVVYVDTPSPWQNGTPEWNDDRFTVRWMTGYVSEQPSLRTEDRVSKYGYWAWEDRGEQTYPIYDGKPETMVVCVRPAAGRPGDAGYIPKKDAATGKRLRAVRPRPGDRNPFWMVVSNEWTTGEQPSVASARIFASVEHATIFENIRKRSAGSSRVMMLQRELELLNQNRRTDERKILELSGSVLLSRFYGGLLAGRGSDAGSGRIRERYGRR
ncbi:MAG: hypothetical protein ACLUEV_08580 [Alistipes sp.]